MSRYLQESDQKLRGGYYTPAAIARWLCGWALTSASDTVLEPSCGDGAFLEAAYERLRGLGASPDQQARQVVGIEFNEIEARKSVSRLSGLLGTRDSPRVVSGDFFEWIEGAGDLRFDCVVGNPPFIRYQSFPEPCRARAMSLLVAEGLRSNRLTNIWVPFVVGAVSLLRPGGRLGMVLPAELLQVSYAGQLRSFLAQNFGCVYIIACNELFFAGAQQEVVLILAENRAAAPSPFNTCRIDMLAARGLSDVLAVELATAKRRLRQKVLRHDSEKWLKYFLTAREIGLMRRLREAPEVASLSRHAHVDVGVVTGANDFFVMTLEEARARGVEEYTIPLIGRSSQLQGAILPMQEWGRLAARGDRVLLFYVNGQNAGVLSPAAELYVRHGEETRVNRGYKCSLREPWYTVPSVWSSDCLLFRQIHDFPRLVLNSAKAVSTDTIHRVKCRSRAAHLATNIYTHLTAASAEIEGRSYGGGVLELEPSEAERLLVPARLQSAMPIREIDRRVRLGRIDDVLVENDGLVLMKGLGLTKSECATLRRIWHKMRDRRHSRRKNGREVHT